MLTEQDVRNIRMQAVNAAAACAVNVGLNDPGGLIQVAEMLEAYIKSGGDAAREVIDSWSASSGPAAHPKESGVGRAQVFANQAHEAVRPDALERLKDAACKEGLGDEIVTISGASGTLMGYLDHRATEIPSHSSVRSELGL